jgi:aminoglycoside N3'-acetyltransferase
MRDSTPAPGSLSPARLADQLRTIGVRRGGVLVVHASYRAVRPVDGGPTGLIEALRTAVGSAGTIVMPSWGDDDDRAFDPTKTAASADLGVTADTFWRLAAARRSDHPFAFAALGPAAAKVTADPLPLPPHCLQSPIGRVYELDGQILLLGVGHDANTTIHLAEILAQVPYRVPKHCTVMRDAQPVRIDYQENDHCCERFALVDEWLRARGLQQEGPVGQARARLARSRDVVNTVREELARDPLLFLHPPERGCAECDVARGSCR